MNYNTNYDAMPELLTPSDEQTPEGLAINKVLLKGVKQLHARFMAYRADVLFRLKFNGQVVYLEKVLNAKFNNDLPAYTGNTPIGIYISDGNFVQRKYRWNRSETRIDGYRWNRSELTAVPARRIYRYNRNETNTIDFIVNIPNSVGDVNDPVFADAIKAWVNQYRDYGSRYILVNY